MHIPMAWMQALDEAMDVLARTQSLSEAALAIVRISQRFGFARCRLWLLCDDGTALEGAAHIGDSGLDGFVGFRMSVLDSIYTKQIIASREPHIFRGQQLGPWMLPQYASFRNFVPPHEDWVHLPLWAGERCWGILTLDNADAPSQITADHIVMLGLLGRIIAAALGSVHQLEGALRDHRRHAWQAAIAQMTEIVQHTDSLERVAMAIVRCGQVLGFSATALYLLNDDKTAVRLAAMLDLPEHNIVTGGRVPLADAPVIGHILESTDPLVFVAAADPLRKPQGEQSRITWLGLPLATAETQLLGVITLAINPQVRLPDESQAQTLLSYARQAALALHRVREGYTDAWLQTLIRLEQQVQSAHNLRDVATLIVETGQQLQFSRVRLWRYEPEGNIVVGLAQAGEYSPLFDGTCVPLVASSYRQTQPKHREPTFYTGRPEEISSLDYMFNETESAPPVDEWASVPLWSGEHLLGLLELDYAHQKRALYPGQRRLLAMLGQQAAAALTHAHFLQRDELQRSELDSLRRANGEQTDELNWLIRLDAFARATQELLRVEDVTLAIMHGAQALGFQRARLWMMHPNTRTLICTKQIGGPSSIETFSLPIAESIYAQGILSADVPRVLHGRREHPAFIDQFADRLQFVPPSNLWVGIPLHSHRQLALGMLVLDNAQDDYALSDVQERVLSMFGRHAAAALERAQFYENERQQSFERNWLGDLAKNATALLACQSLSDFIEQAVVGGQQLGFNRVRLWQLHENVLHGLSAIGHTAADSFRGTTVKLTDLPYAAQLRAARRALVCNEAYDTPIGITDWAWQPLSPTWIEIPLLSDNKLWGVLTLEDPRDERVTQPAQQSLLDLFQQHLSAALSQAQLHEQRTAMLLQPLAISTSIASVAHRGSERQVLQRLGQVGCEAVHADLFAIFPYDEQIRRFDLPIYAGKPIGQLTPHAMDEWTPLIETIASQRTAHYQHIATADQLLPPSIDANGVAQPTVINQQRIVSFACIPLYVERRLFGVIGVFYRAPSNFDPYLRVAIQNFAHQAALVMASARISRASEREVMLRNLHDSMQGGLAAAQKQVGIAIARLDADQPVATVRAALHEVQRATWGLRSELDIILLGRLLGDDDSSLRRLQTIIARRLSGIIGDTSQLDLRIDTRLPELLPQVTRAIIYILSEATVNAVERGTASRLAVLLRTTNGWLRLRVADNGSGFDRSCVARHRPQHGLDNIRKRASEIGGALRISARPQHGTTLRIELPIEYGQIGQTSQQLQRIPPTQRGATRRVSQHATYRWYVSSGQEDV